MMKARTSTRRPAARIIGFVVGCLGLVAAEQIPAATLSLLPSTQTASPGDGVSVQLFVEGLGDLAPDSVGDFDIDIGYDPTALTFGGYILDDFLGDIGLGEAIDFSLGDLGGGLINLAAVSFLEPDATNCVLCLPPYLDDIQPGSFPLGTLDFVVGGLAPGTSTTISIATVNALGDGFGVALPVDQTADAVVRRPAAPMPAPGVLVLVLSGIGLLRLVRPRSA